MIFFFDTETTGFTDDRMPLDHPSQPHIVQIAGMLTGDGGDVHSQFSLIVDPGVPIPPRAAEVHGITTERAQAVGISERSAYGLFAAMVARADTVVAHNIKFDMTVMEVAAKRIGIEKPIDARPVCTMQAATDIVNLPPTDRMIAAGITRPKSPRLEECVQHFFGEDLDGAHDALVDVRACMRVYFHLLERTAAEVPA